MKNISIDIAPDLHAQKAYKNGYFIEAIQVLHSYIELQLRELIYISKIDSGSHENYDMAYDAMFEIPLNMAVKILFIQNVINKNERDDLIFLNRSRNEEPSRGRVSSAAGQGRVIQRVGCPPRKVGQPPGSKSLEAVWQHTALSVGQQADRP